jgi:hypothetical protein
MMVSDDLVKEFSEAIARAEGFYVPDSVPARARNPGDLTDDGDVGNGVIQTAGPNGAAITIYASDADGWAALHKKVRRMLDGASHTYTPDLTIMEVGLKYSGDGAWGLNVAKQLGIDSRMTLAELAEDNQEIA